MHNSHRGKNFVSGTKFWQEWLSSAYWSQCCTIRSCFLVWWVLLFAPEIRSLVHWCMIPSFSLFWKSHARLPLETAQSWFYFRITATKYRFTLSYAKDVCVGGWITHDGLEYRRTEVLKKLSQPLRMLLKLLPELQDQRLLRVFSITCICEDICN